MRHREKERVVVSERGISRSKRETERECLSREAYRVGEGAMTLSVKYFEEMKKQINILEGGQGK